MSKRKGKFIGGYIPKDVKTKLQQRAREQDRPLSWVIEKILTEGVKHREQMKQAA
jgi:predicted transcriptional regulator